jgi:hypothetical protein
MIEIIAGAMIEGRRQNQDDADTRSQREDALDRGGIRALE